MTRLTYLKDQPHLNKIATKSAISDKNICQERGKEKGLNTVLGPIAGDRPAAPAEAAAQPICK
jgi:hypothetical protein